MKQWFLKGNALKDNINNLSLPENCCALWHIGQVGFFFKYMDTTILIDPVLAPISDKNGNSLLLFEPPFAPETDVHIDAVFCTHNHIDHLHEATIRRLAASHPDTLFYIPKGVMAETAEIFADFSERVTGLAQKESIPISDDCSVTAVAACHDHYVTDEAGNEKALGYVFRFGRFHIFHAGDTLATNRLVEDVKACGPITLSLLPINGRDWVREENDIIGNTTSQEAALFADLIQSEVVIPTHYDMFAGNGESIMVFSHYMTQKYPYRAFHCPQLGEPFILYR